MKQQENWSAANSPSLLTLREADISGNHAVRIMSEHGSVIRGAIVEAARIITIGVKTAPKAGAVDAVDVSIITEKTELERLAIEMEAISKSREEAWGKKVVSEEFKVNANQLRESIACILIGAKGRETTRLHCGACGFSSCKEMLASKIKAGPDFSGPNCAWRLVDLGIALGVAAKMADLFNIDCRVMYTIGAAAKRLKLLDSDVIVGIPLSATAKNIYFGDTPGFLKL